MQGNSANSTTKNAPALTSIMWMTATILLVLGYPWLDMLRFHSYPLLSPENGLFLLCSVVPAVYLGYLFSGIRQPWVWASGLAILVGLSIGARASLGWAALLPLVVAVLIVLRVTGNSGVKVLAAFFAVTCLTTLLPERDSDKVEHGTAMATAELPVLIHIILDGFGSIEGIPDHQPKDYVNHRITQLFHDSGFRLSTRAYSRYSSTADSLNNMFNFSAEPTLLARKERLEGVRAGLGTTQYIEQLLSAGYRFLIMENQYFDLCSAIPARNLSSCRTSRLPWLGSLRRSNLGVGERTWALVRNLIGQSPAVSAVAGKFGISTSTRLLMDSPTALESLGQMASSAPPGTALFAHLLLPHEPFALTADCSVDYSQTPWMRQSITRVAGLPANTEQTRILRYANYLRQLLCVADELERLLNGLEKTGVLDRSVVIVHGDHGPRISLREAALGYLGDLTERDVTDVYGTLFAYRVPGMSPSISEQRISLEQALAEAVSAAYGDPSRQTPEGEWVWISSAGLMEQLQLDSLPP